MAVNLSPVGGVAAQFFTNTGAVLTGGKLYTYLAGTTTPATTYTSSNGAIAWTNPIVLDAAGRVPSGGEIWLTDGIIYKFVLKDSTDVLIATYDNITGINSNSVAYTNQQEIQTATAGQTVFNLATMSYQPGTNSLSVFVDGVNQYGPGASYAYTETDSDTVTFVSGLHVGAEVKFTTTQQQGAGAVDASQVSYNPPFTGGVATNVEAKLAQTVSVKDFGAVGDGVTDDTAAIQAAFDSLTDLTDSFTETVNGASVTFNVVCVGTVTFPRGNYIVSSAISTGSYTRIIGDHATIRSTNSSAYILDVYGFETHIEGLSFAGGSNAIHYRQGNIDTAINSVSNCQFNAQSGYSIYSEGTFSTKLNISDCKFMVYAGALFSECDECTFETSWITAYAPNIVYILNHGSMTCSDLILVPSTNGTSAEKLTTYWLQNGNATTVEGGYMRCERIRFGAEDGGIATAINYASIANSNEIMRGIVFDTCGMWGANSIVQLAKIPDFLIAQNTDFSVGGDPRLIVDVDPVGLTRSPKIDIDFPALGYNALMTVPTGVNGTLDDNVLSTNSYFSGAASTGNLGTGGSNTQTSEITPYGVLQQDTYGTDNGSQRYRQYVYSALSTSAEWCTATVVVKATEDIVVTIGVPGLGGTKNFPVSGDGKFRVLTHQFFNPGANHTCTFAVYNVTVSGTVVTWGAPKLVVGYVQVPTAGYHGGTPVPAVTNLGGVLYSTGVPTSGSEWVKGSIIYNSTPTSGGSIGWVCTASGTPGTWKTFGAIA